MPKNNTKPTQLQQRLAESEHAARLVAGLFAPGANVPDFLTDAIFDAISFAAQVKGVEYFGETDFDLDGLASLFFVTRNFDLRHSPEGVAYHLAAVMNNPECPREIYDALGRTLGEVGSGPLPDSPVEVALHLRANKAREAAKVA